MVPVPGMLEQCDLAAARVFVLLLLLLPSSWGAFDPLLLLLLCGN